MKNKKIKDLQMTLSLLPTNEISPKMDFAKKSSKVKTYTEQAIRTRSLKGLTYIFKKGPNDLEEVANLSQLARDKNIPYPKLIKNLKEKGFVETLELVGYSLNGKRVIYNRMLTTSEIKVITT